MKMKTHKPKVIEQPAPFTPNFTKAMVREEAYRLYVLTSTNVSLLLAQRTCLSPTPWILIRHKLFT